MPSHIFTLPDHLAPPLPLPELIAADVVVEIWLDEIELDMAPTYAALASSPDLFVCSSWAPSTDGIF